MDQWKYRQTDKAFYRVVCAQLKKKQPKEPKFIFYNWYIIVTAGSDIAECSCNEAYPLEPIEGKSFYDKVNRT